DVEDVAGRGLRNHQRVARRARHDVEKGEDVLVLIDLVAGQLAAQDLCEDVVAVVGGGHRGGSLSSVGVMARVRRDRQASSSAVLRNGPASLSSRPTSST